MPKIPKTPKLTIVDPSAANTLAPPSSLGEAGRTLWQSIQTEYRIDDAGGRETLAQVCAAADTVRQCDDVIAQDGPTLRTRTGGLREHPLWKVKLAAQAFIVRALQKLNLDVEPVGGGVGISRRR
jgi:terminase small subunit-like protein